jgi:hypothetical protein
MMQHLRLDADRLNHLCVIRLQVNETGGIVGDFRGHCEIVLTASSKALVEEYGVWRAPDLDRGTEILPPGTISVWGTFIARGRQVRRTWALLDFTADVGDSSVTVESDVSDWEIGSEVVISPTGHDPRLDEKRRITDMSTSVGTGKSTLTLDHPLEYTHWAEPEEDYQGKKIRMQAEVTLLSSNVVIRGEGTNDDNEISTWNFPLPRPVPTEFGTYKLVFEGACGNDYCDLNETSVSCPSDCKGPERGWLPSVKQSPVHSLFCPLSPVSLTCRRMTHK